MKGFDNLAEVLQKQKNNQDRLLYVPFQNLDEYMKHLEGGALHKGRLNGISFQQSASWLMASVGRL